MFDPWVRKTHPLEKEMAIHSSILGWRNPWTEEPGRLVHRVTKSRTQLSDYHLLTQNILPNLTPDNTYSFTFHLISPEIFIVP